MLCSITSIVHNGLEPNHAHINVLKTNKFPHDLWHNCNAYGHNIEHNRSKSPQKHNT